jgi:mRNA-degrading endonuclease toxin of MazEF toxin-antitoxin module
MTNGRPLERGDVVLVAFPYVERTGAVQSKMRPAVIVSGKTVHAQTPDVVIAAISSRPMSQPQSTDVPVLVETPEHKTAGLKVNSWIKVAALASVPRAVITRRLGRCNNALLSTIEQKLRVVLELDGA